MAETGCQSDVIRVMFCNDQKLGSIGESQASEVTQTVICVLADFKLFSPLDFIPAHRRDKNMSRRMFGSVTAVFSQRISLGKHVYEL